MADEVDFYRYRDAQGRDVITNDLESVPAEFKGSLELVRAGDPSPTQTRRAEQKIASEKSGGLSLQGGLHMPSFVLGAVTVGVVGLVLMPKRRAPMLLRMMLGLFGAAIVGALYFGWVMRTAGVGSGGVVADPRTAVQEAQKARDQANQVRQLEEELMKQEP